MKFLTLVLFVIFFSMGETHAQWLGSSSSTGSIYRNGTVSTNGNDETGFALSNTSHKSSWGGLWYGLSQGNSSKFEVSYSSNGSQWADPVLLQGWWGLAFRTSYGKMTMGQNGVVTIGLSDSKIESISDEYWWHAYKLYVGGRIRTEEVRVDLQSAWPDYVFSEDYKLMNLTGVEAFIKKNHHLPNIPSASEIEAEGFDLGSMDAKILQQVEELWLHMIELNKEIEHLPNLKEVQENGVNIEELSLYMIDAGKQIENLTGEKELLIGQLLKLEARITELENK